MKNLFKWARRNCRKEDTEPVHVEEKPAAPLTRREKAKVAIHNVASSPPMGDKEKQMLGVLVDYASDMAIPLISARRHCSDTTTNRRINDALQRWYSAPQ